MAQEFFNWANPSAPDQNDGTTQLTLGVKFTVSVGVTCVGVRFWVPLTLPSGPSPAFVSLWAVSGSALIVAKEFEWSAYAGSEGTYQILLFDTPPADLVPATEYVAAVQTFERWGGTIAYAFPETDGILTAPADNGRVLVGYGYPNAASGAGYNFSVSPVVDIDDTTAVLDVVMPAMTVTVDAAAEPVDADFSLTMPAMTVTIEATSPEPPIPPISASRMNFGPVLAALAECVCDALTTAEVPVCACMVTIGQATGDRCDCGCPDGSGSGQLAIWRASSFLSASFPTPAPPDRIDQGCGPAYLVANIVVEILRCYPTVSDQAGNPPSVAALLAATLAAETDASLVRQAVGCCLVALKADRSIVRFSIGQQATVESQGGCAGSALAIQVALPACICAPGS